MTLSRRIAAAALSSVLLFAAGCGGSSPSDHPTLSAAAQARAAFLRGLLTAIDAKHSVHLKIASPMGAGQADITYDSSGARTRAEGDANGRRTMFIIANGVVYIQQGSGGKFLVVDKNDPSYGSLLRTFNNVGPHDSVAGLGKGILSVTKSGTKKIGGATYTRYRLVVDPSKATGAFEALTGSSGISNSLVFNFYVDAHDLLRRVETTIGGQFTTVDLTGWNKPMSIAIPSGSQIIPRG